MPLSITSNTLSSKTTGTTAFCEGMPVTWQLEITDTVSFFNKTVYFNPAQFVDKNLPVEFTNILPLYGFAVTLGGVIGIQSGAILLDTNNTQVNLQCEFELTSSMVLEIRLDFVMTADTDSFFDSTTQSTLSLLQKNALDNPVILENDVTPSVYNQERALRGHFVIGNISTGNVLDQITADFLLQARFYEDGLIDISPAEYDSWSFVLERSGEVVTTLSKYEDTTIKIQADDVLGAGIKTGLIRVIVYREDNAGKQLDFIQDLSAGVHINDAALYGIDYITSFTPWALVAGTLYECELVIDKDKVNNAGTYRVVAIIENSAGTVFGSAKSETISAAALPSPVTGVMTGEINDYNDIYTGNCLQVAPYERVQCCAEVDKASYNVAVTSQGLPGTFDTNFFSLTVRVYDSLGSMGTLIELNDKQNDPALIIEDTFSTYKDCVEFRIPPEWSGVALAVDHIYTYRIDLEDNPYEDVITFRQLVNARGLDEDPETIDELLTDISFFDNNNDPVIEICEDFVGPLRVQITKNATVNDYNLIAMLVKDLPGLTPEEQEDYDNNILEQLDANEIIAVDVLFGVDNIADFTVSQDLLEVGQKYKVIAVAKEENLTPPTACPVINMQSDTKVTGIITIGGNLEVTLDINFAVTNFAPSTVSAVSIDNSTIPKFSLNQNNAFVTDTGNYAYLITWEGGFNGNPVTLIQDVEITLLNGCVYNVTLQHEILPIQDRITNENTDVDAE